MSTRDAREAFERGAVSVLAPDNRCFFLQIYGQAAPHMARLARGARKGGNSQPFRARYDNGPGIDAGGLYRDMLTRVVEDCFSPRCDLFVPTPNTAADARRAAGAGGGEGAGASAASGGSSGGGGGGSGGGSGGSGSGGSASLLLDAARRAPSSSQQFVGCYVPNPRFAAGTLARRAAPYYEFFGKFLGLALRTGNFLPTQLPPLVWKGLVGEEVGLGDLFGVDADAARRVGAVCGWAPPAGEDAEAAFSRDFPGLAFAVAGADGRPVELQPGGADAPVPAERRVEWASAALAAALTAHEGPVAAIRRGLAAVVPARALRLLAWEELERGVAGRAEVSVAALRRNTRLAGFRDTDSVIRWFWEVLEEWTDEERSAYM